MPVVAMMLVQELSSFFFFFLSKFPVLLLLMVNVRVRGAQVYSVIALPVLFNTLFLTETTVGFIRDVGGFREPEVRGRHFVVDGVRQQASHSLAWEVKRLQDSASGEDCSRAAY